MKAWGKRMIWFFGLNSLWCFNDVVDYITGYILPTEHQLIVAIISLLILVIPLIFMEDDE